MLEDSLRNLVLYPLDYFVGLKAYTGLRMSIAAAMVAAWEIPK